MNKAFVREPEATASYCPRCGSLGISVLPETLDALIRPEARGQISSAGHFCPFPSCLVAYFDDMDRLVMVDDLVRPVYPKSLEAPVCACFQITEGDLADDAEAGRVDRIRELIAKSKSEDAHCSTAAASGRPCVSEAQRLYLRFRNR